MMNDSKDDFSRFAHDTDEDLVFDSEDGFNLVGGQSKRRGLRDSTVVLAVIFLVAGAVLYGMRRLATQSLPTTGDANIETEIESALQTMFGESGGPAGNAGGDRPNVAISSLTLDRTEAQVPLEMVKKNPFILWLEQTVSEDEGIDDATLERRRLEEERARMLQKRDELERKASQLRLTSVMGKGPTAVAVIDDRVVQVGDTIGDLFKVTRIEPLLVTLTAGEHEFKLELELF